MRRALYVLLSTLAFSSCLAPLLLLARKTRGGCWSASGIYRPGVVPAGGWPRVWLHGASARRPPGARADDRPVPASASPRRASSSPPSPTPGGRWPRSGSRPGGRGALRALDLAGAPAGRWRPPPGPPGAGVRGDLAQSSSPPPGRAGARVVLTNGRFSPSGCAATGPSSRSSAIRWRELDLLLMREDDEAERALSLGAPLDRVWVTREHQVRRALRCPGRRRRTTRCAHALGCRRRRLVLMAGSTHEGEEEILLGVWDSVREAGARTSGWCSPRATSTGPRAC